MTQARAQAHSLLWQVISAGTRLPVGDRQKRYVKAAEAAKFIWS